MSRKKVFPDREAATKPGFARSKTPESRRSGPAPKTKRELSEAPTLPPPPIEEPPPTRPSGQPKDAGERTSGMRARRPLKSQHPSATVDEVTADLSKDPRREVDDD
ncbi:MAG: hypothetical protein ACRENE_11405 [Polyangiaceae bacterium]